VKTEIEEDVVMDAFLSKPVRVAHLEKLSVHWLSLSDAPVRRPATPPSIETGGNNPAPPVDMETFLEVAGHEDRIPEMAGRFIQHTREQLGQLKDVLHKGAAADVKRIAHSNAGSSAMCGMTAMLEPLRELERLGHTNQLANAPAVYDQVVKEFERVERFFQSYRLPNKTTEPRS
jgi:HPt (histidine-containing phosphotransfer) domain-containing protein